MMCLKEGDITLQCVFRDADGKDREGMIKLPKALYSFETLPYANMMKIEDTLTNFKILEWNKIEFILKEEEH